MKKIIFIIIMLLIMPISIKGEINDSKLKQEYIGDIYAVFEMSNGEYYLYLQDLFIMNGKTAYCIEPNVHITTSIYSSTSNFDKLNLPNEVKEKIKLIAYYGYDYFNKSDIKYFLAAQELIWETVLDGKGEVYWTSIDQVHGPRIDVEQEKNNILDKVNKNNLLPSFNNNIFDFIKGQDIIIEDKNLVLNDYEIINTNKSYVSDNKLYILDNVNSINLKRKSYTDEVFMFYYSGSSQKFLTSGYLENKMANVNINIHSGEIEINKIGETFKIDNGILYENIPLSNVVFELIVDESIIVQGKTIYNKGDVIGVYKTNEEGKITIKDLYFGKYILKEVSSSMGNIATDTEYKFELIYDKDNPSLAISNLNIENELPKGSLELIKIDKTNGNKLPNTKFQLYTENDEFILETVTNEEGKILIENLPLGKYYLVEVETVEGYILDSNKICFEIKENKEVINLTVENEPVIEVPNTLLNKDYTKSFSILGIFCVGVSLIIYDKKNRISFNRS